MGERTVLDVLDAEQEVLDAKAALIRARRDRVVFSYQLAVNVGGLAPQSLGLNPAVPDYVASYESAGDKIFSNEPTYKP